MHGSRTESGDLQTPLGAFRTRAKQYQKDVLAINTLLLSASQWFAEDTETISQQCEKTIELLCQASDLFRAFHQLLESASQAPEVSPHIYTLITALRVNTRQAGHLESLIGTLIITLRNRNSLQKRMQLQSVIYPLLEALIQDSEESMQEASTSIDRSYFQEKILTDVRTSSSKPKPQKAGRVIKLVKKSSI